MVNLEKSMNYRERNMQLIIYLYFYYLWQKIFLLLLNNNLNFFSFVHMVSQFSPLCIVVDYHALLPRSSEHGKHGYRNR